MRVYSLPPTVLFPGVVPRVSAATLAQDLAALGYPGFAHLARRGGAAKHPGAVLLTALAQPELEARPVEALPGCSFATGASTRPGSSARPRCATSRTASASS